MTDMRWYVWLYIVCLILLGIASAHDQYEEGRGWFAVAVDVLSSIILVYFVVAYFNEDVAGGQALNILLAGFAVSWSLYDGVRELRNVIAQRSWTHDPGLSARANLTVDRVVEVFAASAGIVVVLPAVACAIAVIGTT